MAKDPIRYVRLLEEIYEGKEVVCPQCKRKGLEHHLYASGGERVGFAQFHCPHCDIDAHLCRVRFPEGVLTEEIP